MQTATTIAQWTVRLTGITQVVLGLLFWTNRVLTLVPLHMAIGLTFVIAVWALAAIAARAGVSPWLVAFGAAWGIVVLALGITQGRLLPGPMHWVVKVLHLLVGFAAMALAARLAGQIRKRRSDEPSTAFQPHGGIHFRVGQ